MSAPEPTLELHRKHVEAAFGDVYVLCSCGSISAPYVTAPLVLTCPIEDAIAERVTKRRKFFQRFAAWTQSF